MQLETYINISIDNCIVCSIDSFATYIVSVLQQVMIHLMLMR